MSQVTDALSTLRDLGTPAEIRALAERRYGPASPPRVNAHIHLPPNFSAFDSVEQAVTLAADQTMGVLGVSNYYYYDVYGDFGELTIDFARLDPRDPMRGELVARVVLARCCILKLKEEFARRDQ